MFISFITVSLSPCPLFSNKLNKIDLQNVKTVPLFSLNFFGKYIFYVVYINT